MGQYWNKNRNTGTNTLGEHLETVSKMSPEELLRKYNIITYEREDVAKINKHIAGIKKIIDKYEKRRVA